MEHEIVPLTAKEVIKGNKLFGAAMLNKHDLSTIIADTNQETLNPLFHAEVQTINHYYSMPKQQHVAPGDVLFLATHEPCTLCSSAITWAGFDNFYYFFSHEDSRDSFKIGHDLKILKQVFKHEPGGYARENDYWTGYGICDLIENCAPSERAAFEQRASALRGTYQQLSDLYQQRKGQGQVDDPAFIPLG
ncbi:deaminase [Synechococcus sp. WH 7805]|uniref:deaminase n=2 Tax=Synechococcus TaxID=1129 RepID=UPI001E47816F|nr:deaminase [Synechococcus sp. WH 7805]